MAVMLDLETLGLHPGCVVMSIGAIEFDPLGELPEIITIDDEPTIPDGFYQVIDIKDSVDRGLTIDPETEKWWQGQDPEARDHLFDGNGIDLATAVERFNDWYPDPMATIWANGASFDQPIWQAACRAVGAAVPWNYRKVRDCRTLFDLSFGEDYSLYRNGPYPRHHALFDCYRQIGMAQAGFRKLGIDPAKATR
jgi:hypothetical protein